MNRRHFLAGAVGLVGNKPTAAASRLPNVVMIMTDDHGAWSLGCYGNSDGHTSNIDHLAAGGVRFTRAFAASAVCSPSRMSYMTGKIPSQHGVQDYILSDESHGPKSKRFLDGHTTYSEILARYGYRLGFFGKWHMGDDAAPQKGFQDWFTIVGGPYRNPKVYRGGRIEQITGYKTDIITDKALEFIQANQAAPFFAEICYNAPHTPYDYQPDQYRQPYLQSSFPAFPNQPPHPNQIPVYRQYLGQRGAKLSYMALVNGVDQNLGRILRRLEQLHLRDSTLLIFCADQGFNCGHHGVWGKGNGTLPFNMYEQTLLIPFIFSHPDAIPSGRVLDPMVSTLDFFPTLLDYLGLPPHRDRALAGSSFAGFLRGKQPRWENRIFSEYAYVRTVRTERFKYIQKDDGHADEMYDLEADPEETRNIATDPGYGAQRGRLKDELATWFAARGAPPIDQWRSTARNRLDPYHYQGHH